MNLKPAYRALDQLINREWKTRLTLKPGEDGSVKFRGFKGRYRVTYTDTSGATKSTEFDVKAEN
ncbi:MAG: hypothetical protein WC340_08195 [Kiritimatiellia bacterium]